MDALQRHTAICSYHPHCQGLILMKVESTEQNWLKMWTLQQMSISTVLMEHLAVEQPCSFTKEQRMKCFGREGLASWFS